MSSNIRNKNMGQMSWQHSTPNYNKDNWRYVDQLTVDIATTSTTQTSASHQHRIDATGWYRIRVGGSIAMIALVLESPVIIIIIPGYAASRIRSVCSTAGSDTTIAAVFWRIMQDWIQATYCQQDLLQSCNPKAVSSWLIKQGEIPQDCMQELTEELRACR